MTTVSSDRGFAATERRIHATIRELEPFYRTWLQALVRVPSTTGHEGPAQDAVRQQMGAAGLIVDSFDIDPESLRTQAAGFNPTSREGYAGRPCVVGKIPGRGTGRSLILNAHVDTVPVDTPEDWTNPPFAGHVADGRLYGRGSLDDKAGIAECLLVAHAIRQSGIGLDGDLVVESVIEDESTGNGSLACVARGYTADGVIIVDGTWPERYIVSHLGHVSFRIRLIGTAGHAASLGPNPVDGIGPLLRALREFVKQKNDAFGSRWGPHERPFFLNVGSVRGGVWSGSVPAECLLEGQYGFAPPQTCEEARAELADVTHALSRSVDWPLATSPVLEFAGLETPPFVGDPHNAMAELLAETVSRLHGGVLQESIILGHCDLRHFQGSAAVLYGPGGGRGAHGIDEFFQLDHLGSVAATLSTVALRWCGVLHGAD